MDQNKEMRSTYISESVCPQGFSYTQPPESLSENSPTNCHYFTFNSIRSHARTLNCATFWKQSSLIKTRNDCGDFLFWPNNPNKTCFSNLLRSIFTTHMWPKPGDDHLAWNARLAWLSAGNLPLHHHLSCNQIIWSLIGLKPSPVGSNEPFPLRAIYCSHCCLSAILVFPSGFLILVN